MREVATTVYNPRCSAAMLRMLRGGGAAAAAEVSCQVVQGPLAWMVWRQTRTQAKWGAAAQLGAARAHSSQCQQIMPTSTVQSTTLQTARNATSLTALPRCQRWP